VPTLSAPDLRVRVSAIFRRANCPEAVAERVATSLVEANLTGHDSHGVIRVPAYVRAVSEGRIDPHGEIRAVQESATTAILDCAHNFGQVGAMRGIDLAIGKARAHDIAAVALQRSAHVGRLGEYVAIAAQRGMVGLMVCNGTARGGIVAPYGGTARALGSNPIAWAVPGPDGRPIFLDYATSVSAQGKIQVALDEGHLLPEGWLLDKEGQPTRDPREQSQGGVMLPFGGHKGYALSVIIELLAGGLSSAGPALLPDYERVQGVVLVALRVETFCPLERFQQMAIDFARELKATRRAPDCDEILLPGEPEWRSKAARERDGIPLPDRTWERLAETASGLGLEWPTPEEESA
jgi:LDH2 family malate/lactate/ureidoglycolate dehydrogenase